MSEQESWAAVVQHMKDSGWVERVAIGRVISVEHERLEIQCDDWLEAVKNCIEVASGV